MGDMPRSPTLCRGAHATSRFRRETTDVFACCAAVVCSVAIGVPG